MKKATGILLIIVATLSIVTHGALPHHHHSAQCMSQSLCQSLERIICLGNCEHDHGDEPAHPSGDCPLDLHAFTHERPDNSQPQIIIGSVDMLFEPSVSVVATLALPTHFNAKPYITTYHQQVLLRHSALRAPPCC